MRELFEQLKTRKLLYLATPENKAFIYQMMKRPDNRVMRYSASGSGPAMYKVLPDMESALEDAKMLGLTQKKEKYYNEIQERDDYRYVDV